MKCCPAVLGLIVDDRNQGRAAPSRLTGVNGSEADGAIRVRRNAERADDGGSEIVGAGIGKLIFSFGRLVRRAFTSGVGKTSIEPRASPWRFGISVS